MANIVLQEAVIVVVVTEPPYQVLNSAGSWTIAGMLDFINTQAFGDDPVTYAWAVDLRTLNAPTLNAIQAGLNGQLIALVDIDLPIVIPDVISN